MKRSTCHGCPALNGDGTCTTIAGVHTITITPDMELGCTFAPDEPATLTNGDYIRGLGNKELADFLSHQFCHGFGVREIEKWLEELRNGE